MEFIFQLFAQMFAQENTDEATAKAAPEPVENFETEVEDSPLAQVNFFKIVDFH